MKSTLLYLIAIIVILSSCVRKDHHLHFIQENIVGSWRLDSITCQAAQYSYGKAWDGTITNNNREFTFYKNREYVYNLNLITSKGRYFILFNPSRNAHTLSCIPDYGIIEGDTMRDYMNFDIERISDSRMQLVDKTERYKKWGNSESSNNQNYTWELYSERRIYKKIKKLDK
jgi:hypothetical protein